MPYKLEEAEGGFYVVNSDTGERKSKKPLTEKRAKAQMRALYAFAPDAKAKEAGLETVTFQITAPADVLKRFAEFLKSELEEAGEGEIEEAEEEKAKKDKAVSFEVSSSPDVIDRFVKFMAGLNKAGRIGHSGTFGMFLDGDGNERFDVTGIALPDVKFEYARENDRIETMKEVDSTPTGIPAHGPGGLFSTPGLGGKVVKAIIGGKGKKKATRKEWGESFAAAFKESIHA